MTFWVMKWMKQKKQRTIVVCSIYSFIYKLFKIKHTKVIKLLVSVLILHNVMLSIFSTLDSMKTNMNWFLLIMEVILEITFFRAKLMFFIVAVNIVSETYEYWNTELSCKSYIWYYNFLPGVHLPTKTEKVFSHACTTCLK